jgi:molybdate transport system substrate-binding protein
MLRREVLFAFRRAICVLGITALFLLFLPARCTTLNAAASTVAAPPEPGVELTVSAAISLKDALDEIAHLYSVEAPGVVVRFNLGGSGTLQRQIEQGAPVDIFISASPKEMDGLAAKGLLLTGTRRDLVRNSVVLIVPAGTNTVSTFQDLTKPAAKIISIGEPQTVPAGKYAQEILTHLGLYDQVKAKLVLANDVRQVLTYVETGNADAGIVYATDAKSSNKVSVVATAPEDSHSPVLYPGAVIKNSSNPTAAKQFLDFLAGDKAKAVFQKYGFIPAAN